MNISIIIPSYNNTNDVLKTIVSVPDGVEIIVCDDCSTDNSLENLYQISDIIVTSTDQHKGSAACINQGIKKATHQYINILIPPDQHDLHFLQKQLAILKNNNIQLTYGTYHNNILPSSLLFNKQILDEVGWFDEGLDRTYGLLSIQHFIEKANLIDKTSSTHLLDANRYSVAQPYNTICSNIQQEINDWYTTLNKQYLSNNDLIKEQPIQYKPTDKELNIVWIGYIDPGGISAMYKTAIEKYTPHKMTIISLLETRGFDSDIVLHKQLWGGNVIYDDHNNIEEKIANADILIFSAAVGPNVSKYNTHIIDTLNIRIGNINLHQYIKTKTCVIFFYGSTALRRNYEWYYELYQDYPIATCQPDILHHIPDATYIPIIVDLDNPRYSRNLIAEFANNQDAFPKVIHSPTDRPIKNTKEYEQIAKQIDVSFGMCENMGFEEALQLKKQAHIALDQMQVGDGYYCLSSVENSALGLINIVYLDRFAKNVIAHTIGTKQLPWISVSNQNDLLKTIQHFITNSDERRQLQIETYNWIRKWWHPQCIAGHLARFLEQI